MRSPTRTSRNRWIVAGLAAGAVLGAVAGVGVLTQAGPGSPAERPTVLHAAPALVSSGSPVELTVGTFCAAPEAPSCRVTGSRAIVRPAGAGGSVPVPGASVDGVLRFTIPADLVPAGGFAYAFELDTADGIVVRYPPGSGAAIHVLTTRGLPIAALPAVAWDERAAPSATVVRLPVGSGPGRIGLAGVGEEGGASGPSSFDVAPDGSIVVADWVQSRALRFEPDGTFRDAIALPPDAPVDVAIAGEGLVATTLGTDAQAFEVSAGGAVTARYPIGYGVASRIEAGDVPRVRVGAAQWVPVRGLDGVPLSNAAQAAAQSAAVPRADGAIALTSVVRDGLAVAWTRPDGSSAGALLRLPGRIRAGADYFVRPTADGGAVVVQGLWDDTHFAVAAIRLTARGDVARMTLLPEPTTRMAAPFSTVRPGPEGTVYVARDLGDGMRIDRFEVS